MYMYIPDMIHSNATWNREIIKALVITHSVKIDLLAFDRFRIYKFHEKILDFGLESKQHCSFCIKLCDTSIFQQRTQLDRAIRFTQIIQVQNAGYYITSRITRK